MSDLAHHRHRPGHHKLARHLGDETSTILAQQSAEFPQHFPADGWVGDPEDIWQTTIDVTTTMVAEARSRGSMPTAIGITNQRETAVIWDRTTGKPIHNAIVWQDRRTADICAVMKHAGKEDMITEKTGLLLDPYFTATKFAWILDRVEGARDRAAAGELCFAYRQLPYLASDRWRDACHRRHQCQPHQPLQHT